MFIALTELGSTPCAFGARDSLTFPANHTICVLTSFVLPCRANVRRFESFYGIKATHVPVGYSPVLDAPRIEPLPEDEKDIDVLFDGTPNSYRIELLQNLTAQGVNITWNGVRSTRAVCRVIAESDGLWCRDLETSILIGCAVRRSCYPSIPLANPTNLRSRGLSSCYLVIRMSRIVAKKWRKLDVCGVSAGLSFQKKAELRRTSHF